MNKVEDRLEPLCRHSGVHPSLQPLAGDLTLRPSSTLQQGCDLAAQQRSDPLRSNMLPTSYMLALCWPFSLSAISQQSGKPFVKPVFRATYTAA